MKTMRGSLLAMALVALVALMALTACGKVITPQPTASSSPAGTTSAAPTVRPTATAPITPPPATATPAATATPVIHVVQGGETLLSIAFDYGVSLQALQDINRIENPQLLQVGQSLIIPTGGEGTGVTPGLLLPTPTRCRLVYGGSLSTRLPSAACGAWGRSSTPPPPPSPTSRCAWRSSTPPASR